MAKLRLKIPQNIGNILSKEEMKKITGGIGSYNGSDDANNYNGSNIGSENYGCYCSWDDKNKKCVLFGNCNSTSYCKDMGIDYTSTTGKHICTLQ